MSKIEPECITVGHECVSETSRFKIEVEWNSDYTECVYVHQDEELADLYITDDTRVSRIRISRPALAALVRAVIEGKL